LQLHNAATGFNLSALKLNLNGVRLAGDQLLGQERGGAAGADAFGGKLGGFLNAGYSTGSKDQTSREDGFDFDSWGLVGGLDYRFRDNLVGGVALNYGESNSDITTFPGGSTDNKAWGISLYGTFYQSEAFYVDAHVNYTRNDFDTRRRIFEPSNNVAIPTIDRTASGSTKGDQVTAGLSAGYNIKREALTITPFARLEYLDLNIDGYTESGAIGLDLQVDKQSVTSVQSALGVQLAYAISSEAGVYVPQLHLEWNHEFDNGSRSITARYAHDPFNLSTFSVPTNTPDRNFFTLGAGVSSVMRNGVSLFVDVQTVLGYDQLDIWGITAGARMEF
jgi:outer membrane autotransporter protein